MEKESQYKVIEAGMTHLGDQPTMIGTGTFWGTLYSATFSLPDNIDPQEFAVIQCRTLHNELPNKMFFLNHKQLGNILEAHPKNQNEWMMDIAVVGRGHLKPGENIVHIGYSDTRYDDFLVDNIVLWYKTLKPTGTTVRRSASPRL